MLLLKKFVQGSTITISMYSCGSLVIRQLLPSVLKGTNAGEITGTLDLSALLFRLTRAVAMFLRSLRETATLMDRRVTYRQKNKYFYFNYGSRENI